MLGYAFSCPDMIGGGEYANFTANSDKLDDELFVRYAPVSYTHLTCPRRGIGPRR